MKRVVISLTLLLACAVAAAGGEPRGEVEYYRQLAEKRLAEMQAAPEPDPAPAYVYHEYGPANFFAVLPQYFHSSDEEDGSRANGMALRAVYSRALGECFSFSLLYEYAFMKAGGGERWRAHTAGLGGEIALGVFGRVLPSLAHAFEHEEGEDGNTTSLTAWWEKDFAAGVNWIVTPYAGWDSRHGDRDEARFPGVRDWTHSVAAGLKLGYQNGCLGVNLRAGLSHRLSGGDAGYGMRALASGVTQYSRAAHRDGTVSSVGAGVSYAIGANVSLGLDYDGFFGGETNAHAGAVSFGFAF